MKVAFNSPVLRALAINRDSFSVGDSTKPEAYVGVLSRQKIELDPSISDTSKMRFDTFKGPLERYGSFLVLDLEYEQVKNMRAKIEQVIERKLDFFQGIRPEGEAHITLFTPVEAQRIVAGRDGEPGKITMDDVDAIAKKVDIDKIRLRIAGIGSASKVIDGKLEETFFLIVEKSESLLAIRREIEELYLSRGGEAENFDPEIFYPHITIGYTLRDLHFEDGVVKDKEHSLDSRFPMTMKERR